MRTALRTRLFLAIFLFPFFGSAQITVRDGATLTLAPGTQLTLPQHLLVEQGGRFQSSGSLLFSGNFTNYGTAHFASAATVIARGNTLQKIAGTAPVSLPFLSLQNAAGIALEMPVTITDSLQLVNGKLYATAASPVHFAPTAANPVETNSNHIVGVAVMDNRWVGTGSLPTFLGFGLSAGADVANLTVTRTTGASAVVTRYDNSSIASHWQVQASAQPAALNRTTAFSWLSVWDNEKDATAIDLYGKDTAYKKLNGVGVNVSGSDPRQFLYAHQGLLKQAYTLFDTVFVIRFLKLTAVPQGIGAQVEWMTGTEKKNTGFEVERSYDGVHFETVHFEAGKNKPRQNSYAFFDRHVRLISHRVVYYRIKQINFNGSFQYSNVVPVAFNGLFKYNVYPNSFSDAIDIDVEKQEVGWVHLRLVNVSGSVLFEKRYQMGLQGHIRLTGLNYLPAGTYFLQLMNPRFNTTKKLIKNHN